MMGRRRSAICRSSKHPGFRTKAARNRQGQTEFAIIVLVPSRNTASLANSEQRVLRWSALFLRRNVLSVVLLTGKLCTPRPVAFYLRRP